MSTPPSDPVLEITHSILTEAAQRPWLAALLMRRRPVWLTRLAHLAQRVRNLPRHTRRALRRKLASGLAAAALLLALAGAPTAYAANITVGSGVGGLVTNSNCSLAEAIINANNNAATWPDCPTGSGADTITLPAGATLSYTSALGNNAALPDITSQITIEANGSTIKRDSAASTNFRILNVMNPSGNLTLNRATISSGYIPSQNGGGILNYGTLILTNSTVSGNDASAAGAGGGIVNANNGTMSIVNSTISGNAGFDGGGVTSISGSITVVNSTISGNTATRSGGGFELQSGTGTITNGTIVNNHANFVYLPGGGICNFGTLTLNRTLVVNNTAPAGREIGQVGGTINANNVNLFGHSGETNAQAFASFTPGATDITATSNGTNPTALVSILDTTLANNGSQLHPWTHALISGSPAIDKIPKATCDAAPVNGIDERGAVRAGGGTHGGALCDIGAYEVSDQTPNAVTLRDLTATANAAPGVIGAIGAALAALGALLSGRRVKAKVRP